MLWGMVMALGLERKEKTMKDDWCEPAMDPPTVKSIFSLEHRDGGLVNSKIFPWLNVTWSFYRELGVGLLVRIYYHHGRCVELMEKNGVGFEEFSPCSEMIDYGFIM